MKKYLMAAVSFMVCLAAIQVWAGDNKESTAGQFLRIDANARACGMG
ncbi:MAG: hypothetical protein HY808_09555 [Nitrospirae bacterium]|nr:hypothetical protein [Nitrospirota bacterium]